MKKLLYILSAGLFLMALASCGQTEIPYVPGEPDSEDCFGVFFPDQDASKTHYFEPTQEKKITVTVKRTKAEGEIDVPIELVGEGKDVFDVTPIHFNNGEEETTFTVELKSTAEQAKEYPVTIEIQNPTYASKYSANNAFISLSAMIVVWETLGTFTFDDTWGMQTLTAEVVYYDIEGIRTCKTQNERDWDIYDEDGGYGDPAGGFFNIDPDVHLEFKWYKGSEAKNAMGYDYVELPPIYMFESGVGPAYICDYLNYYQMNGKLTSYDFLSYIEAGNPQGFTLPYYDPRGELNIYFATPIQGTSYWYGAKRIIGLKEGYVPTDYSLSISSDVSANGKVPVTLVTGADVASVKYAVYEGALGNAALGDHIAAMVKGTEPTTTVKIEDPTVPTLLEIALEESGEYTIIVLPVNAKGEIQADEYAATTFAYLAEGDENPVEGDAGIETLTGRLIGQGYNSDAGLELWIYGKDIVVAKYALFQYVDIVSADEDEVDAYVKAEGTALTEAEVAKVNDKGYSAVVTGLLPGTKYISVVYLSNGYEETWIWDDASTTGDPLPVYMEFDASSYDEAGEFENRDAVIGTWNYYGQDVYGNLGLREYLGKVVFTASETETEGPDSKGLYDEYVYAKGLFGDISWLADYDFPTEATVEMDVYGGIIYHFSKETVETDNDYAVRMGAKAISSWDYSIANGSAFIPVLDGYYAFVDVSQYAASYNFCGLGLISSSGGWIAKIWDPLLVDPAKDDNGLAPASIRKATDSARKLFMEAASEIELTGNQKEDMHKIIERYNSKRISPVANSAVEVPFYGKAVNANVTVSTGNAPAKTSPKTIIPREF